MEDECGVCNRLCPEMYWDGSYECDAADCPDQPGGTVSINYSSDTPIAGFQFNVTGVTVTGAGGGAAEEAGFMISSSETTVLGFSLSGDAIPAGSGVLIVLDIDGNAGDACIEAVILSDSAGYAIDQSVSDCVNIIEDSAGEGGCMDAAACNYNENASYDDGSCDYGSMCWDGSYECNAEDCPDEPGGWDGDACTMDDFSLHVTSSGSVLFNSSEGIAGFQFNVDGASVLSASGGEAEAAGFMISNSEITVLGFSLTGVTFDGCGTMIELELDGEPTGLSGIIVSDAAGVALPFEYFDGSGGGTDPYCGDGECNGDEDFDSCPEDCEAPAECESDVCLSFSNFDETAGSVDIWMENSVDVAGYQIELDGITLTGASGGSSEDASFMISNSSSMVLGFSVSGDVIPPSSGNLVTVTFSDYVGFACFVDELTTFSDANAGALGLDLGDCQGAGPVEGCTDMDACNYNADANIDDGSCDFGTTGWDGSTECDASDCPDMPTVDVLYSTDTPIAGFQFIVTGATVASASGGAAEAAGFQMAAGGNNNAVVGFSLTGDYIPAGEGVLTVLEIAGDPADACIDNVLISDPYGYPIEYTLDCLTLSIGGPVGPECGDGFCDEGETAENCPEDCGDDDCVEVWDGDACTMDINSIHVTSGGMVLYNTDTPIAGFQFDLDGANIISAGGGNSDAAGYRHQQI